MDLGLWSSVVTEWTEKKNADFYKTKKVKFR